MKYHDDDIVDHVIDALRKALNLYYDFKCLTELSEESRTAVKNAVEEYLRAKEKGVQHLLLNDTEKEDIRELLRSKGI
jgi:hypothetical protein